MPISATPPEAIPGPDDDSAWPRTAAELHAEVHEVDRTALRIGLASHPFPLVRALREVHDPARLACEIRLVAVAMTPWNGVLGSRVPASSSTLVGAP